LKATNASNSTATLNLALTVNAATAPVFGALPVADFVLGAMGSVAITASGFPTPSITETGTLPAGLTFVDNGNGTALLSGTPTATGTATLTLTAANKVGSTATQSWSVMVGQAPAFTSAGSASASVGSPFSFTVTTSGYPAPWITETAALPAWLTFTANADGTATFSGTPTATDIGQISVGLGASSLAGSTSQTLDLTVAAPAPAPTPAPAPAPAPSPAPIASASPVPPTTTTTVPTAPTTTLPVTRARHTPAFSSAASATATVGHRFSFKVLAVGEPVPALAHSALPKGLSWSSAGNGRATISGVPQVKAAGLTRVSLRASNAAGSATEILVIRVQRRPGLSGGPLPAAAVGRYYHASLSTYGYPRPTVTKSGQLPTGVSLKTARNGEITLSGVPAPSTAGTHHIGITVSNSLGKMTVHFVLTVKRPSA
jgi:hypothetical protein